MTRAFLVEDSEWMIPMPYEPERDFSDVNPSAPYVGEDSARRARPEREEDRA